MHIFCLYTYREGVLFHGEVTESVLASLVDVFVGGSSLVVPVRILIILDKTLLKGK